MSADITQERIRKVLAGVLAPLARILLRCGVSYTEFAELSKGAFIDAASKDYGVRNRPTNIARVAVMTGLSRKEVSRLRREIETRRTKVHANVTLPAAILNVWHTNPRYSDRTGTPKVLPFAGSGWSFSTLVRGVSRDIPPGAMRRELVRAGTVRVVDRTHVVPTKRHFVPDSADEKIIVGLELGLRRLTETIAYNSDREKRGAIRFQRFVEGPPVRIDELPQLRNELHELLSGLSLSIDDFLSSFAKKRRAQPKKTIKRVRAGIGLYYFDESND